MQKYEGLTYYGDEKPAIQDSLDLYDKLHPDLAKPLSDEKYSVLLNRICSDRGWSWVSLSQEKKKLLYELTEVYRPLERGKDRTVVQGFGGSSALADTLTEIGLSETGSSQ